MSQLASTATSNGEVTPYTYGADPTVLNTWDAATVYGCSCDSGFSGHDCSRRQCPVGEDPALRDASTSVVDEVQALTCVLLAGMPTFVFQFRDAQSTVLAATSSASDVVAALEAMQTVGVVAVSLTMVGSLNVASAACTSAPGSTITITFLTVHGDIPPLRVVMSGANVASGYWAAGSGWDDTQLAWTGGNPATAPDYAWGLVGYAYVSGSMGYAPSGIRAGQVVRGTAVDVVCSGRGLCDNTVGTCKCFTGWGSSDGMRGPGGVGDCGYREPWWPVGVVGPGGG